MPLRPNALFRARPSGRQSVSASDTVFNGAPCDRRAFMGIAAAGTAAAASTLLFPQTALSAQFTLPKLPYAQDALEPYISARTLSFHYGKHHAGYVRKTDMFTEGTPYAGQTLSKIVRMSRKAGDAKVFNNAAQTWNHSFYWKSMRPGGGGKPTGKVRDALDMSFGSYDLFRKAFTAAALGQFGSGWAWLVEHGGKLEVMKTANAETPLGTDAKPLLVIDVWEHAYYLDYQNLRKTYVDAFLDHLVNWYFVAGNMNM